MTKSQFKLTSQTSFIMKIVLILVTISSLVLVGACSRSGQNDSAASGELTVIQNTGSDTMVNLAQAWAEEYAKVDSTVSIEVSGGGSGTGIAALINGTVDIANCSRKIEPEELERARQNTGQEPMEYIVGYDALAVYVHKNNPMTEITIEQLAEIYGENGKITRWSQMGVTLPGGVSDDIILISRQSNSGTYHYFREAILGKGHDFRLGTRDLHGSKDVVELIAKTPGAIGYSGMGYAMPEVKMLRIARKAGEPAIAPTVENTMSHAYPISRPLIMYSLGTPSPALQKYLDWVHTPAGQKIVIESGYVPMPDSSQATL